MYNSFPLKNIKLLVPTTPPFSAHAHFWYFNFQQHSFNLQQLVLKICSNYFKFAASLFNLQQLHFIYSNFISFAARFFNLHQLYFICSHFLICSIPLWATISRWYSWKSRIQPPTLSNHTMHTNWEIYKSFIPVKKLCWDWYFWDNIILWFL